MDYDRWLENGAKHFDERLREETQKAIAYPPKPLPSTVLRELDQLAKHWK